MREYDFVAIGDTVIDAFIRLENAEIHTDNGKNPKLCLDFGTKIPYEAVYELPAVGNSANASVAAARLGLSSALITNIGDDTYAEKCITHLKDDNVSTEYVLRHEGKKTNYHYVLWFQDERTILIKHEAYAYSLPAHFAPPKWIYLSSFAKEGEKFHDTIADYLQKHPHVKLAFQPGTYQLKLGLNRLKSLYARTEVFICNVQEAQELLEDTSLSPIHLLKAIHNHGPTIVVITDGKRGAYILVEGKSYFMPPYPDTKPPLERTGAGDSFASTFVSALALGLSPLEAIMWAPINSASVVQYVGAQKGLLTKEELKEFLHSAPENYKPQEIQ